MDHSIIQFPSFVCLSSLTVLYLTALVNPMYITCYSSNQSKELTLKFPVLRQYHSHNCIWLDVKRVTIEAPLLEKVEISRQWVRSWPCDVSHAEIVIRASYITKYRYEGYISSETILLDAHVDKASISLTKSNVKSGQQMKNFFCKLFNINNLKCLTLIRGLAPLKPYLVDIPAFRMLSSLDICYSVTVELLLALLFKSPCLETLVLQAIESYTEPPNFAIVPECFLSTLKVVRFVNFAGGELELSFAKFVMENSQFLESISFSRYTLREEEIEKIKEKIFLVKRSFNIEYSAHSVTFKV
ncbi:F-box/FBD/LRR-repeat protein At3g14710-like [Vicia villosa]|uniref:F-box/FBD/LRR-repeat protein At3g14710-like n=1 Tax=Vicia villosa TaxID=3911 RepID=UPI00273CAB5C|nr:F-box/FBD/LRR-repeat protein At3g14710-like [Vicia villosa]